ncbi:MAG: response regulator [Gammaproteobacteria bacterium]|nr:response regulator [Gammaproteobacteria bacterium]
MAKVKVVIADDNEGTRDLLNSQLSRLGCEVLGVAKDGNAALSKYWEFKPDLFVIDIDMPKLSGTEVLKQVIAKDADAFVVMVTGDASSEMVKKCITAGASGYIVKPFNLKSVSRSVAACRQKKGITVEDESDSPLMKFKGKSHH